MKKRLIFIFSLLLILTLFIGVSSAVETTADDISGEEYEETASPTLISRVWEFLSTHKEELITIGSAIGTAISIFCVVYRNVKAVKKDNSGVKKELQSFGGSLLEMAKAHNLSAEEFNKLSASYEALLKKEEERDRMLATLVSTTSTLLDIQTTVYANSKNLPSGIKDVINVKYSKCLKSSENNTTLKTIFDSVKQALDSVSIVDENSETEQVM